MKFLDLEQLKIIDYKDNYTTILISDDELDLSEFSLKAAKNSINAIRQKFTSIKIDNTTPVQITIAMHNQTEESVDEVQRILAFVLEALINPTKESWKREHRLDVPVQFVNQVYASRGQVKKICNTKTFFNIFTIHIDGYTSTNELCWHYRFIEDGDK